MIFRKAGLGQKKEPERAQHPGFITLDGHRRSRLYRDPNPSLKSSWFKYSGEREGQRPSPARSAGLTAAAIQRKQNPGMGGTMSDSRNNPGWDRWIAHVDACALAALRVVRELEATGVRSHRALARELNNRGVPTVMRRKWYARTVHNLLAREANISNQKQLIKQGKRHE